ncbi:MAG: 3-oxoacyl-ACP synthase [Bacteroidales bacterium]|nr:3-oxoacyl-ACP synthase [Bacteroidales bacterium]
MIFSIGDSIISPLAMTSHGNFEAVMRGESRLQYYEHAFGLPEPCFISLMEDERIDRAFETIYDYSVKDYTKMEKAAILAVHQAIAEANIAANRSDVIFILSTTKGNVDLLESNPYEPERPYLWRSAQLIAEFFGNPNTPIVVSNACISGCAAQIAAANQLRYGGYKYAVVVGAETLSKFVISGFQSFKALSKERCMPFDGSRCGLNLGEAAAAIVYTIDDDPTHIPDNALILRAGAINNDANHISGPSRTGEGLLRAINKVIAGFDNAQPAFDVNRLAFINAHGTATLYNDDMESVAISRANLQQVPVNSLKGYFGHTLGAAGILETIMAYQAIKNHTIIGTKGTDNPAPACPINVATSTMNTNGDAFMKLISGFGGSNAALLMEINRNDNMSVVETHGRASLQPEKPTISVISQCDITDDAVVLNGQTIISRNADSNTWLADIYRHIGMAYPKFFKMDNLCKAGTLAAELLLKDVDFDRETVKPDWAVVLMNSASSLDDDRHYQTTIQDADNYYPSPAVFVYTLANIITGEIAIRHKIGGESSFYVVPAFSPEQMDTMVSQCFSANPELTHIICGWADYDEGKCEVKMQLLEKNVETHCSVYQNNERIEN